MDKLFLGLLIITVVAAEIDIASSLTILTPPTVREDPTATTIVVKADKTNELNSFASEHQTSILQKLIKAVKQEAEEKITAFRLEAKAAKKETEQKFKELQEQIEALKQEEELKASAIAGKTKAQEQEDAGKNERREAAPKLTVKQSIKETETEFTLEYNSVSENWVPTCPTKFVSINDGCYHFASDEIKGWNGDRVMAKCRTLDPRASVLSLETQQEWDGIRNYLTQHNMNNINWRIGGSDQEQEGKWKWVSNNQPVEFTDWCRGEPNDYQGLQDCMMITGIYETYNSERRLCWDDIKCNGETELILPSQLMCETKMI